MIVNGLALLIAIIVIAAVAIVVKFARVYAADERADRAGGGEADGVAWILRLRHGPAWATVAIRAQLATLHALIQAAQTGPPQVPQPVAAPPAAAPANLSSPAPPPGTITAAIHAIGDEPHAPPGEYAARLGTIVSAAIEGECPDPGGPPWPLSAPREWHAELEDAP